MATENEAAPAGHQPYVPDQTIMPEFTWSAVLVGAFLGALGSLHESLKIAPSPDAIWLRARAPLHHSAVVLSTLAWPSVNLQHYLRCLKNVVVPDDQEIGIALWNE